MDRQRISARVGSAIDIYSESVKYVILTAILGTSIFANSNMIFILLNGNLVRTDYTGGWYIGLGGSAFVSIAALVRKRSLADATATVRLYVGISLALCLLLMTTQR